MLAEKRRLEAEAEEIRRKREERQQKELQVCHSAVYSGELRAQKMCEGEYGRPNNGNAHSQTEERRE